MISSPEVIDELNKNLRSELTAINQYLAHAAYLQNQGYTKLAKAIRDIAKQEREHSEELIERIMFLHGSLTRYSPDPARLPNNVQEMLSDDFNLEHNGVCDYNMSSMIAHNSKDIGTHDLFGHILKEEEVHMNFFESQLTQISQMGLDNYLASQV